jgi:hypothetical protein
MMPLNMKDTAIVDAFPVYDCQKTVLEVGCGDGALGYSLAQMGYRVYATDIYQDKGFKVINKLTFHKSDIFDLSSFPVKSAPIVIASEVLEHLSNWKLALVHLIALAEVRLIITVPWKRSFMHPDHRNFWDDVSIKKFYELCNPFSTSITKIRTKERDVQMNQYAFLIVVDKRQGLN